MMNNDIDTCNDCGKYVAGSGLLQAGPDGQAVLVCPDCDALSSSRACPIAGDGSKGGRALGHIAGHRTGVLQAVGDFYKSKRRKEKVT